MGVKNKRIEAYSSVCEKASELCPRLVPSPLWGLSLSNLARMEPRIASVMSDRYPALVEKISRYWLSLNRKGGCEACGGEGNEIDENWLYFVFNDRGEPVSISTRYVESKYSQRKFKNFKGLAYLWGFRLLCTACHTAKHQGYARTQGRGREALEHLQKVNRLVSLDEAEQLVDQALSIHHLLSHIKIWRIQVGRIRGLDKEARRKVQNLLNHMYGSGFRLRDGWLYYLSPAEISEFAKMEGHAVLAEVGEKAGKSHDRDEVWVRHLVEMVKGRLEAEGISVSEEEFTLLVRLLRDSRKNFVMDSVGKWIVHLPNTLYERAFRRVLEVLEKRGLAYQAKILCERGSITDTCLPIFVYAPTSFAPSYISAVAKHLGTVLNEFGLTGRKMYYKPDAFTYEGIYSGKGRKASIYSYLY